MNGLTLARLYFQAYGVAMLESLKEKYPDLKGQIAAGLVGQGSECLGFDDEISKDHDYGPSFCIWLRREVFEQYGAVCQEAYDALPGSFMGFEPRKVMAQGQNRVGVLCAEDFYLRLLGTDQVPERITDWFMIPDHALATAVNGEVFLDEEGYFTKVREGFIKGYPEDVRMKKIAAKAALMAQSGQYNYSRLCRRGEWTGASLAMAEFVKSTCEIVNLLNGRYTPFYKWMHRSIRDVQRLPEIYDLIDQLTDSNDNRSAWNDLQPEDLLYGIINTRDKNAVLIETICQLIIRELKLQGLSDVQDMYLEPHALAVTEKIQNPAVRSLPLLYG